MILRRKPPSDMWDFRNNYDRGHVAQHHSGIYSVHGRSDIIRFNFSAYAARETGQRWSDFAVEITWEDIAKAVERFAVLNKDPRAIVLVPLIRLMEEQDTEETLREPRTA
jgi:hypothetical protein